MIPQHGNVMDSRIDDFFALRLREAYLNPYMHDVVLALTKYKDYLSLTGNPAGYDWTKNYASDVELACTIIKCNPKDVISEADTTKIAHLLHKVRCDDILAKAHSLAAQAPNRMSIDKYVTTDHIMCAKDRLQAHAPGQPLHLHLDQTSFDVIKHTPGISLCAKSPNHTSYDAYRGTLSTPREEFLIHIWVTPTTLTQRDIPTTKFMTTHGGLLFRSYDANRIRPQAEYDSSKYQTKPFVLELCDLILGHRSVETQEHTEEHILVYRQFSMSIGNPEAIIAFPHRAKSD